MAAATRSPPRLGGDSSHRYWNRDSRNGLTYIFDRFYRVDTARSLDSGSSGLGLAIAQQIVQAHGGHIRVTRVVGQGSTFQVELPLKLYG